ncbi:MAG: PAS domain-containing sensor histidine kinase, partial [Paracoccaceae bacterium]
QALEQYTDVIIRQTGDLRRIVDEFSKFARMPEPERRQADLLKLLRDAVVLQENVLEHVALSLSCEHNQIWAYIDQTMISQALINLIKNAGEAIESRMEKNPSDDYRPQIRIAVAIDSDTGETEVTIADNGTGLPENRARLFEPYVTTREKGTGLGLSIVKKIIEEHGGTLELLDAPPFDGADHVGAMARIVLPVTALTKPKGAKQHVA